jgi:hypothetical protein
MPKVLHPKFCCFLPMVFRSILPKDEIEQQKFWQKWGTKQA